MYLIIDIYRHNGTIVINGLRYIGYNIHDAIKLYRRDNGLKYKHLITIINRYF